MKELNLVVSSAGRRVELIKRFQKAKRDLGIKGRIIAVDCSDTAPACFFADQSYRICRISEEGFIHEMMEICKKENASAIIPTIDTELLKLSQSAEAIEREMGTKTIISNEAMIQICRNKYHTADFLQENGFSVPRYLTKEDIRTRRYDFPLFIKPLDGSSSVNALRINNQKELDFFISYIEKPIVSEFAEGIEYTVDILCDFSSKPITIVPRRRLAVRSGEISKGLIEKNRSVISEMKRLMERLKPIGPVTVQVICQGDRIRIIEINPRFGGGVPMSMAAGANSAEAIYRLLRGETLKYEEGYQDGLLCVRFDDAVFIDAEGAVVPW